MTITLRHRTTASLPDGNTPGAIKSSHWNDTHDLSMDTGKLLGRATSNPGTVEEVTPDSGHMELVKVSSIPTLRLKDSGAIPGTYASANITVDDKGRVIHIENGLPNPAATANKQVWVGIAQSNGVQAPSKSWVPAVNGSKWNNTVGSEVVGSAFVPLSSTTINLFEKFVSELAYANPNTSFYLVNVSFGGEPISSWMAGASSPDAYQNTVDNVEAALAALGLDKIDGIFWRQGESDAGAPTTYIADFATVIARFHAEDWCPLNTPIIVSGITSDALAGTPYGNFNNYLQYCVGADPDHRIWVYPAAYGADYWDSGSGNVHMNADGYELAGRQAALAFMNRVGRVVLPQFAVDAPTGWIALGTTIDPFHLLDMSYANPARGLVARVRNSETSAPTGALIAYSQAGGGAWGVGVGSTGLWEWWVSRTSSADGTLLGCIDGSGRFVIGHTAPFALSGVSTNKMQAHDTAATGFTAGRWAAAAGGPQFHFLKSRGASIGTHSVVSINDIIGDIFWGASDGAKFVQAAKIHAIVNGTPGTDDMPGAILFSTTADGAATVTERLRITAAGALNIATGGVVQVNAVQILRARMTGWTVPTGTAQRSGYATYTSPDISASPTEAEVQAIADALQNVSRTLMGLITDLHGTAGHGLIGT